MRGPKFFNAFLRGPDEFRRELRDDCVTVTAQTSHSTGYPMSQRECAGFSWPIFSVATGEPFDGGPWANQAWRPSSPFVSTVPTDAPSLWSRVVGVLQPANVAASVNVTPGLAGRAPSDLFAVAFRELAASVVVGVGHPVQALPDVRRPDARSAQIGGPDGISQSFQVVAYTGEPRPAKFARNLFPKDRWRAALAGEGVDDGPQVPLICRSELQAGIAKGLARARGGPDGAIGGPIRKLQGERPPADTSEEMMLRMAVKVAGSDVPNISPINVPRGKGAR
jgi:hypothetical protein